MALKTNSYSALPFVLKVWGWECGGDGGWETSAELLYISEPWCGNNVFSGGRVPECWVTSFLLRLRSGRPDGLRARGQILISAQRTVLSVSEGETEVKACPPERGRVCAEGWETPRSPCEHRTRPWMGSTVQKQHTYTHTHSHTGRPSISVT